MYSFVRHATLVAVSCFSTAIAQAGYAEAMNQLATRNYPLARAEFEQDTDNPKALYQLSLMARQGLGEAPDPSRAALLLGRAAQLGYTDARLDYVYVLANGNGVAKDVSAAIAMLNGLTAEGSLEAEGILGRMHRFGWWGQPTDPVAAVRHFERAMAGGDAAGRSFMGQMLVEGAGVPKDEQRGAQLQREGAESGHIESQIELARLLMAGIGVPKDEAAGFEWYLKAADKNNRVAQYRVGMAYLNGQGVARDEGAAARWIDASARQGWGWAQYQLGSMYSTGKGFPRIPHEAYYWYSVAARNTTGGVAEFANNQRATLARTMTDADMARLGKRAEAFRVQEGFGARRAPLPALSRNDKVTLGPTTLSVPTPRGYANAWEQTEFFQRAYPNSPELRPLLLNLIQQDDVNRMKLGLPGAIRSVEISRHLPDDTMAVSASLFASIKHQLKDIVEQNIAAGRYRSEGVLRDDDRVWGVMRTSNLEPNRLDAIGLVRVKEKVLAIALTGFGTEQRQEVSDVFKNLMDELVSANRPGFFSGQ
jgi:TPR repeat protein